MKYGNYLVEMHDLDDSAGFDCLPEFYRTIGEARAAGEVELATHATWREAHEASPVMGWAHYYLIIRLTGKKHPRDRKIVLDSRGR